ncbi:MAG: hypothetical protein RJQ14_04105, partial [Marinoscillum sp.]
SKEDLEDYFNDCDEVQALKNDIYEFYEFITDFDEVLDLYFEIESKVIAYLETLQSDENEGYYERGKLVIPAATVLIDGVGVLSKMPKVKKALQGMKQLINEGEWTKFTRKLDDLFGANGLLSKEGKFIDDILESDYQKYVSRKTTAGKTPRERLDWKEARDYWLNDSPIARGNTFNETARIEGWYPFDEVTLSNRKRLDSYRLPENGKPGEIVSRKATDLDDIQLSTFESYLSEMKTKYAPGTPINAPKYGNKLKGKVLEGDLILELPDSNLNLSNIQDYIDIARKEGIILRFKPE